MVTTELYNLYLLTPAWRDYRQEVLAYWGYRCALCVDHRGPLEVHHRTYRRLGREKLTDSVPLCDECHRLFHGRLPRHQMPSFTAFKAKQPTLFDLS